MINESEEFKFIRRNKHRKKPKKNIRDPNLNLNIEYHKNHEISDNLFFEFLDDEEKAIEFCILNELHSEVKKCSNHNLKFKTKN